MRRLPPLNSLKAFEAVARLGSTIKAADELCVSHGAISKQLATLEAWLVVPLFHRTSKGLVITKAGSELLRVVEPAFDWIASATNRITSDRSVRHLIVSAPPTITLRWLVPRLTSFLTDNPGIRIQLNNRRSREDGLPPGVDIAITRGVLAGKDLHQTQFMAEALTPVCAPSLLEAGPLTTTGDLSRVTWLVADMRPADWSDWLRFAGEPMLSPKSTLSFDHTYLALEAARDGLGVAMGPVYLLQDGVVPTGLQPLFPNKIMPSEPYMVAFPKDLREDKDVLAFHDWLISEGRAHEDHFKALLSR
ncbi:LysR substrate-binding domain-containing protein [Ottowia thiooxydans]|uniref:LysR substrate-binding domain-containing protein n=1 Tax=Ottowia thiooxydans TaxID=219182 RepID=UPI000686259E|nr:LysR substrate-binding domain-containing protein [Ottowia thiooxydans]